MNNLEFKPMLSPKKMIHKGIFGGTYFSKLIKINDFPNDWFDGLDEKYYLSEKYNKELEIHLCSQFFYLHHKCDHHMKFPFHICANSFGKFLKRVFAIFFRFIYSF